MLITWPDDRKTSDERVAATRTMFDGEFDAVAGESSRTSEGKTTAALDLAEFPRLERITWFARRVAERAAARSLAEHVETKLRGHFEDEHKGTDVDTNESLLEAQLRLAKSGGRLRGDGPAFPARRGRGCHRVVPGSNRRR